ncbi:MAG: hypothetical protein HY646_20150 [Acidobacteria bacterium]|nr:hypothetical protein [Acidobacteriota bacterium]
MIDKDLRKELLILHARDENFLERAAPGDPRIDSIHRENAARLDEIMAQVGWPGRSLVGEAGMRAAWRIVQNATTEPEFQRRALHLLQEAIARGDAPAWQAAMLEDRICKTEARPQVYGTQPDWPIAEPETVDDRRRTAGLMPIALEIEERKRRQT